jgi:hypothetical protein
VSIIEQKHLKPSRKEIGEMRFSLDKKGGVAITAETTGERVFLVVHEKVIGKYLDKTYCDNQEGLIPKVAKDISYLFDRFRERACIPTVKFDTKPMEMSQVMSQVCPVTIIESPVTIPEPMEVKVEDAHPINSQSKAKKAGYTGNICQHCGSTRLIMAGKCEVCTDCGNSSGCS